MFFVSKGNLLDFYCRIAVQTDTCIISFQGATNIETIDFEGNFIGSEGGVYFGDVLAKNKYLTDIVCIFLFYI